MAKELIWFRNRLTNWYSEHKRDLPWRKDPSPFKVWISEIIFQQTRIDQGLGYYHRFLDQYSDIGKLAQASEEEILKLWQGLGYYSRARNLHKTAKIIAFEYAGSFPSDIDSLKKLPGIGDYTAGAIASIAFNKKESLVDGNVYRLFARFFAIEEDIGTTRGKKYFKSLADKLVDGKNPGDYNQALMDFGATVCTPSMPFCNECVLNVNCTGLKQKRVSTLPIKSRKTKKKNLYLHYFILDDGSSIKMRKRTKEGIWKNLYELPNIESEQILNPEQIESAINRGHPHGANSVVNKIGELKHELSHKRITATYYKIRKSDAQNMFTDCESVSYNNIKNKPVSSLMVQMLRNEKYIS